MLGFLKLVVLVVAHDKQLVPRRRLLPHTKFVSFLLSFRTVIDDLLSNNRVAIVVLVSRHDSHEDRNTSHVPVGA